MDALDRHWRYAIVFLLIVGYVGLGGIAFFHAVPQENVRFVDGFFTGIGPIVGAAVAAVLNLGRNTSTQTEQSLAAAIDKLPPAAQPPASAAPENR